MSPLSVFGKTARGSAEVAQRTAGLTLTARRVLIMVDGRRTLAELAPVVRPGELEPTLTELWRAGFIEPVAAAGPPTQSAAGGAGSGRTRPPGAPATRPPTRPPADPSTRPLLAPTTPAQPPPRTLSLDEAKRRAARALRDRVGPDADDMVAAIERCRTSEEFAERLVKAERLLSVLAGEAAAAEFLRTVRAR